MINWISKALMFVSMFLVAAFTIPRTLHFIQSALPESDKLTAYFALAAFDLGIVVWALYFTRGARSIPQFSIAAFMVVASVVGVITTLGADMVLNAESRGMIASDNPDLARTAIYACVIIFAFNIIAKLGIHVTDPAVLERIKEALVDARVIDEYFKEVEARAPKLAKQLADERATEWEERTTHRTKRHIEQERKARELPQAATTETPMQKAQSPLERVKAALNGHGPADIPNP